jgi:hypothetical protein
MGKLATAAAALREVAEMYRGFAIVDAELGKLRGLVEAEAELALRAAESEGMIASTAQRAAETQAKLQDLTKKYHAAIALIQRDPRVAIRRLAP